jgi:asparagine synthase (glutamine-hydrolysing)
MGFGVPIGAWFRGELASHIEDRLLTKGSPLHEYLRPEELARLVQRHRDRVQDYGLQFWNLSMLDAWLRRQAATGSATTSIDEPPNQRMAASGFQR